MAKTEKQKTVLLPTMVWLCRIIVGATFIVSGWAKSVDPWGFIYKIEEYFTVWGMEVPREITLFLALAVSIVEFVVGILIFLGAMRRASVWLAAAFMVVLLPLTAYIAVADPVADCGCFGDFLLISNTATLVKNIILTGLIIVLLVQNDRVKGLYSISTQWLVVAGSLLFVSALAFMGYRYQPLVDFRPYPVGSSLVVTDDYAGEDKVEDTYIYEKDGVESTFTIDDLPDSTWTFVRSEIKDDVHSDLTVYDGDDDVSLQVFNEEGKQLILVVTNPGLRFLKWARLANELYGYVETSGVDMLALVAADGDEFEAWQQLALPDYPAYSVEDTSLKSLVRGDAALIYMVDGKIVWKRNMASISPDAIQVSAHDDTDLLGSDLYHNLDRINASLTAIFGLWLVLVFLFSLPERILSKYFSRRSIKNS